MRGTTDDRILGAVLRRQPTDRTLKRKTMRDQDLMRPLCVAPISATACEMTQVKADRLRYH
jgi:hypothetical protein